MVTENWVPPENLRKSFVLINWEFCFQWDPSDKLILKRITEKRLRGESLIFWALQNSKFIHEKFNKNGYVI